MNEQIHIPDLRRFFIGEVPAEFYIELVFRAAFVYLLLMVAMRLIGKRMSARLGRNELVALVTLAATIGLPLTAPERGLLPSVIITFLVVVISRWIAARSFSDTKFEQLSQGDINALVNNGVMDLDAMKQVRLTRERLVCQLRQNGIKQLGEVKRLYMEANGSFSLVKQEPQLPGLFIIPRWDHDLYNRFNKNTQHITCENCGYSIKQTEDNKRLKCKSCGHDVWTTAIITEP